MKKGRLLLIKFLIISFPLLIILGVYLLTDPFKVIYSYHFDNYYNWQHWEINRELASVENLKERIKRNDVPDAFIFGNSRSTVFHCDIWESFLGDHSKPYHFDAASESLFGFYTKVKYLNKNMYPIKDALLVCDVSVFAKTGNDYDVTHIKHPEISGESKFAFQSNFIKGYFSNFFFFKQIDFLLFGKIRNYMKDIFAINPGYISIEPYKNDHFYHKYDSILKKDSVSYYLFKKDVFYERPDKQETSETVIKEKQIEMLTEIKRIFDKNHTNFRIVISPLYDQRKINEADIRILANIFGKNVVHDYSGINEITATRYNYYESSHYKPYIAEKIMTEIYSK